MISKLEFMSFHIRFKG